MIVNIVPRNIAGAKETSNVLFSFELFFDSPTIIKIRNNIYAKTIKINDFSLFINACGFWIF